MNVTDPIRRLARLTPAETAIIRPDNTKVSFFEFDRLIDIAAHQLAALGIIAGQIIGLAITGPDEFRGLVVGFGLARLGAVSADPSMPADAMDIFISEGGPTEKPGIRRVAIHTIWASMTAPGVKTTPFPAHPGGAALYRYFASSGTTGRPKVAAISHEMMTRRVMSNWRNVAVSQAVHLCAMSKGIEYGATHVLRTLWSGGALVLTHPPRIHDAIRLHNVTSMVSPAIILQKIVEMLPYDAVPHPSLQSIEVGGSPMPIRLRGLVREKLCVGIRSHYGSTETGAVASAPFLVLGDDPGIVGYIHAGVDVEAVDENDQPLPAGTEGILRIRSPNAIDGYALDAGAAGGVFRGGWFYNGDIGSISSDGLLRIAGRAGEFINSGGNKVAAAVIEEVLLSIPEVTEAAAFGVPDKIGLTQIWGAIVANVRIDNDVIGKHCRAQLGEKAPKVVMQIRGLPRNANGKVLKDELIKFAVSQQR